MKPPITLNINVDSLKALSEQSVSHLELWQIFCKRQQSKEKSPTVTEFWSNVQQVFLDGVKVFDRDDPTLSEIPVTVPPNLNMTLQ